MSRRATIKDIAARTGVSTGTVDRVLHNRGNVAPEVSSRVLEVLKEIGYEPNIMARTLANQGKDLRIAVMLPDFRTDPYWAQPKEGVERAAVDASHYGIHVEFHFFPIFDPQAFLEVAENIVKNPPGAILLAPVFRAEAERLLCETARLGIPRVMINTQIENAGALSYIGQDSYQSGVLAGRLLNFGLNEGDHAMILNLDKEVSNAKHLQDKERGFRDFFKGIGHKSIAVHSEIIEFFDESARFADWARAFFERYPRLNGVFVTNSRAYKLIEVLDRAVQKRLKIVGFDLIEPNIRLLEQDKIQFLINQNAWQQGYLGILTLINHILFQKKVAATQYLPLDIVVKENVDYYLKRTLELPLAVV